VNRRPPDAEPDFTSHNYYLAFLIKGFPISFDMPNCSRYW
jgi:hypothetical protein